MKYRCAHHGPRDTNCCIRAIRNRMTKFDLDGWKLEFENHYHKVLDNPTITDELWLEIVKLEVKINKYLHALNYDEKEIK